MKRVLIIKTSSLGDVIHTLPALTDARARLEEVQFDWVVEESFAEIPHWHPAVRQVLPVAIRRWRKHVLRTIFSGEWRQFRQRLQQEQYDCVIDAQGLIKSAWLSRYANGRVFGLDKQSAREPLASRFYQFPMAIAKGRHAVERIRELFAQSLDYSLQDLPLDYGIAEHLGADKKRWPAKQVTAGSRKFLFLHGTTWATKHWPEAYWYEMANALTAQGDEVIIPWGNDQEYQRACSIQQQCARPQQVQVLDKMDLNELVQQINAVDAVVAVDTGLAHLSAALDKPTVALYGPTSPGLTGTYGNNQCHLTVDFECAPCFKKQCGKTRDGISPECFTTLNPERVIQAVNELLISAES